ncbi:MAG: acyltransferase [Actinomycetota bacterium]|nr:acyltransferase [Actinomycetota bacterium]
MEGRRGGSAFRPDVEGLRAVAVLAVVLFHAGVPGFSGGFVGVDVFFVISGFLITGLLWREVESTGTVRLGRFYGARARRLLPAGVLVLIATAVAAVWLLPPLQARSVLGDAVAGALYVGNYRFAVQGTDYLAADMPPSPIQHYWSLGVEEQFYFLWPALLIAVGWLTSRLSRHSDQARPGTGGSMLPPLIVLGLVAGASFLLSLRWTTDLPSWAFFSLPARAWQLAVGGLLALSVAWWRRLPPRAAGLGGWAGLALIVLACLRLDESTPYPGVAAFLPVLGAALVLIGGCAGPGWGVGAPLSTPPMRVVGRLSYSWYLWHWPVLLLAPALVGHSLDLPGRVLAAGVAGGLAALTLVAVENPIRFAAPLRGSGGRSLLLGGGLTAMGVCASLVLLSAVPAPVGQGAAAEAPEIGAGPTPDPATPAVPTQDPAEAALQAVTAQVQSAVLASTDVQAVPANLTPPLADAFAEKPRVFVNGCVRSWLYVGQEECASGATTSATRVALVGDSHAAMWSPALERVAAQRQWRLETMGKVTCPLLDLPITSPYLGRTYTECTQWRSQILDRLRSERPALIVVGMSRRYGPDFGFTVYSQEWLDSLTRLVQQLRSTGASVLVLGPVPDPQSFVPTCLSEHLDSATACSPDRAIAVNDAGIAAEEQATAAGGGHYAVLTDLFCTAARCPVIVSNQLLYRDDNHVTVGYAAWLAPVLDAHLMLAMQNQ